MNDDKLWLLLDTETTGLTPPIFAVDIAAQLMKGWKPLGAPFRRLVKIDDEIPPEVSRIHGYTREILERDGFSALEVYRDLFAYAQNAPVCTYNLGYDYDSVLIPEWQRLGLSSPLKSGFCLLKLTQRIVDPIPAGNHKLQTLRQFYRLPERGAHSALGDVLTVVDLLNKVLKPLLAERNIIDYQSIAKLCEAEWYPTKLPFGKHKGRSFWDAEKDKELKSWIEWLSCSDNKRSRSMGAWYLKTLSNSSIKSQSYNKRVFATAVDSVESHGPRGEVRMGVVVYKDAKISQIKALVSAARERLADLEMIFDRERTAVAKVQAELFQLLKNASRLRDSLKLTVDYRKRFLDTLLNKSDIEPDEIRLEYEHSKARTDAEYDDAEQHAKKIKTMSEPQQSELKDIYRKLVKIYHPDLHGTNSAKAMAYGRLMAIITAAKENGDIDLLREISRDPRQFMENNNLGQFEIDVEEEVETLLRLYDSIQYRIIEIISSTEDLRSDSSYALYQLCMRRPDYIRDVADKYEKDIVKECDELKLEADRLSREIEVLCGECV